MAHPGEREKIAQIIKPLKDKSRMWDILEDNYLELFKNVNVLEDRDWGWEGGQCRKYCSR